MNKHIHTSDKGSLYTGQVEVKVNKNNKYKILNFKNSGTGAFHKYILKALIEGTTDSRLRPYGIKLYEPNGTLLFNTIFPGVNLTTEPKEGDGNTTESITQQTKQMGNTTYSISPYYIKYHFLIPESFTNTNYKCGYIALCNEYGELYAIASVGDGEGHPLTLEVGSNIDITWTLTVSSKEDKEEII